MFGFVRILLSISVFAHSVQLNSFFQMILQNEKALRYKEDLLNFNLGKISTDLKLKCASFDNSMQIDDLNIPKNALLTAIDKYGQLLDVKGEVKHLYELYKSSSVYDRNKEYKQFQMNIGRTFTKIMKCAEEVAEFYDKFIKVAINYAKTLKDIEDLDWEKSPKKWNDLNIEDRAALIELINNRLTTCTDLLEYCNILQQTFLNALSPMIVVLNDLKNDNKLETYVKRCYDLLENEWNILTDRSLRLNINLLAGKIEHVNNPMCVKLRKYNFERESFGFVMRVWKEKAYRVGETEDFDRNTESILYQAEDITLDILLKPKNEHIDKEERETKKNMTDKKEIDSVHIHRILGFMQDENGVANGYNEDTESIRELSKVKKDLLASKREYDLIREDLKDAKAVYSNVCERFPEKWRNMELETLSIGAEMSRFVTRVDDIGDVYADALGLASNIIKELEQILNEKDVNKKWENIDPNIKKELIIFVKKALIACTILLKLCNDPKKIISHHLNEVKNLFDNQELEIIFENWQITKNERSKNLRQAELIIDKLSGKEVVDDKYAECRNEFNKYSNDRNIIDWKQRAYQHYSTESQPTELKPKTGEGIIQGYKSEMEYARLHEISYDLRMDYLLIDDTRFDGFNIIKNLNMVNEALMSAISKYEEMLQAKAEVQSLYSDHQRTYYKLKGLGRFSNDRRSIGTGIYKALTRLSQVDQVYEIFIEFALKDLRKFSEVVVDPNTPWKSVTIKRQIELVQELNNRLIPCSNLLKECDVLQPTALNALNGMRTILIEMMHVGNFENFVNKFKQLLENHENEVKEANFRLRIDLLLNRMEKIPEKGLHIYNKWKEFNEMKGKDSFEEILSRWKSKSNLQETTSTPQSRKRKLTDISNRVIENTSARAKNARQMRASKLQINNEHLFIMIAFLNENTIVTYTTPDFDTPKKDLLAAIDEYDSMLNDLTESKKAFSELANEFPETWNDNKYSKLTQSIEWKLNKFNSRLNDLAEVYEVVVGFATNIINELNSIVFEEENFPWDLVDLDNRKELLEMTYIRLIACKRPLRICNSLRQKVSPALFEVKNFFANSLYQSGMFFENVRKLGISLNKKIWQIKPALDKLTQSVVVDLTKHEDKYGRYEFNKWLHSWRRDIIDWKLRAYHGIRREHIVESSFERAISDWKERAYQRKIGNDTDTANIISNSFEPTRNAKRTKYF